MRQSSSFEPQDIVREAVQSLKMHDFSGYLRWIDSGVTFKMNGSHTISGKDKLGRLISLIFSDEGIEAFRIDSMTEIAEGYKVVVQEDHLWKLNLTSWPGTQTHRATLKAEYIVANGKITDLDFMSLSGVSGTGGSDVVEIRLPMND